MFRLPAVRHTRALVPFILLIALTFATWSVVLRGEFVNWDDTHLILQNPRISHFSPKIFTTFDPELYIPLTLLTFQIEHALFGFDPFFFHLDNLFLHTLNVLLLFALLRSFFPPRTGSPPWIAFVGALLFAVHPLHTESIAWISARKDLLSTFFFLLAFLTFRHSGARDRERTVVWLSLSLFLFLLALLSKVTAAVLPLVLLFDLLRQQRFSSWKTLFPLLPFFLLSTVFIMVAAVGQQHSVFGLSFSELFLLAGARVIFALQKFFLPLHLLPLYPAPSITLSSARYFLPLILLPGATFLTMRFLRQNRVALLGGLLFLLPLLPSLLSYVQADTVTLGADRYLYLPSIGLIVFLCGLTMPFLQKKTLRIVLAAGVMGILLVFSVLSHRYARTWGTSERLFQHLLQEYPDLHIAWNNLGFVYFSRKENDRAFPYFLRALELRPNYPDAHLNVAAVYARRGELTEAEEHIREAVALAPNRPLPHYNLGGIHFLRGEWDEAIIQYKIVLQLDPFFTRAAVQLAKTYLRSGDEEQARESYRRAIVIDPAVRGAHTELNSLLL